MVDQVVVDVALPYEIRRECGRVARLVHLLQEFHGMFRKGSTLPPYEKPSCEAWVPVRRRQKDQDLA